MKIQQPSPFIVLTILAGLVGILVTGCQQKSQEPRSHEKITVAYTTSTSAVLVHVALNNGYFKAEGLEVTSQPETSGKAALDAVVEGKADFATVADTPIMFAIARGHKIYIIAEIQTSTKNEGLVARKDSGINRPADLKGKKIGVTLGTTGDFFMDTFFLHHGIDRKRVKIIDLKPEEMSAGLSQGQVDAVSIWNPVLQTLKKELSEKGIVFFDEHIYTELFCVVTGQDFAKKNPGAIIRFLRALIKAEEFVKQHPETTRKLIGQFTHTDKAILDDIWDGFNFRVSLNQSLLVNLEDQTRWAKKYRLTGGAPMPNYLDYIYFDGLQAVKPEAIRIIR